MANTNAPFGFRQASGNGSAPTYEQVTLIGGIYYSYSTPIFYGDPVVRVATGTGANDGTLIQASTGATTTLAGVFQGCKYLSTSQKRTVWSNYWPGSDVASTAQSTIEAYIINDPNAQFIVQSDATGTTTAQIGLNVNFNIGTGNTATGISGAFITPTTTAAVTAGLPFRIVSLNANAQGSIGPQSGAYAYTVVAFNNVETKNNTAV